MSERTKAAVTFDYGQTLAELDTVFLARRARELGLVVDPARLDAASPRAWREYDAAKARGDVGKQAWSAFMSTLIDGAILDARDAVASTTRANLVEFLWAQQPAKNLWRRPIPGMVELVRDLSVGGVRLGIVSNSEGRLAELLEEMGLAPFFPVVADSGVLGFEKPDPRIFAYAARGLGVETEGLVHVGDAWEADVMGAMGVGASALWVSSTNQGRALPPRAERCSGAPEIRTALRKRGFPA